MFKDSDYWKERSDWYWLPVEQRKTYPRGPWDDVTPHSGHWNELKIKCATCGVGGIQITHAGRNPWYDLVGAATCPQGHESIIMLECDG